MAMDRVQGCDVRCLPPCSQHLRSRRFRRQVQHGSRCGGGRSLVGRVVQQLGVLEPDARHRACQQDIAGLEEVTVASSREIVLRLERGLGGQTG